jgi:trigger factor
VAALSFRLQGQEIEARTAQLYAERQRRMEIPGFRKGKAPLEVIQRYVPVERVREDAVDELVQESYGKALEQTKLEPLEAARAEQIEPEEGGSVRVRLRVTVRPEIQLGKYKGLKLKKRVFPVAEEHVDAEIEKLRQRAGALKPAEDKQVEKGNIATVDWDVEVDGQKVEGQSAKNYPVEVGSDKLFTELNEVLLGARVGDERRTEATFPQDLPDASLAGKKGQLIVTVKQIHQKSLPDLDDEFARRMGAQSVLELRQKIRAALEETAEKWTQQDLGEQAVEQVVESSKLEIPAPLVDRQAARRKAAIERELEAQSSSLDEYLSSSATTERQFAAQLELQAKEDVRRALVLDCIGRQEGIEVEPEEIEQEIQRLAEDTGVKRRRLEAIYRSGRRLSQLMDRLYQDKVIALLLENAEIEEEPAAASQLTRGTPGG